jgi:hypothetical protein
MPLTPLAWAVESPLLNLRRRPVSETRPAARAIVPIKPDDSLQRAWTVHTVESWARAVIDDMVKELGSSKEVHGVESQATWACFQFDDGSLGARLQILGAEHDYLVHHVKIG